MTVRHPIHRPVPKFRNESSPNQSRTDDVRVQASIFAQEDEVQRARIEQSDLRVATTTNARKKSPTRTTGVDPGPDPSVVAMVSVGGSDGAAVSVGVGTALGLGMALGVGVGDAVGLAAGVGDAVGLAVGVGDAVGAADAHADLVMVSLIKVTSPFRASARPSTATPLSMVMDVRARIVPTKVEPDPSVAELAICQKTLHELAPLMSFTELDDAVMSDDVAWKTQTEFGSFWPSSVRVPVRSRTTPPAL